MPSTAVGLTPAQPSPEQPRRAGGRWLRALTRGLGETLITVGCVLLLYVVYEVWISNIFADREQHQAAGQLATTWQRGQDPLHGEDAIKLPSGTQVVIKSGIGFANLYIPRFGKDYAKTIVQGTDDSALQQGPGHYQNSQIPGQIGNFAIAGHRVGKGEPFLNLDQLRAGDPMVVQTAGHWYVYRVLGNVKTGNLAARDGQGVVGREIVSPSDVGVLDPVPDSAGTAPTRALMTLTTCHPKYSANQRMIVHAALARSMPVSGSATPRELAGGTL